MPNDVVDLILADHRKFEDLLREVRNVDADRERGSVWFSDGLPVRCQVRPPGEPIRFHRGR
jgi:hypothetical protein